MDDDQVVELLCDYCAYYPVLINPGRSDGVCPGCDATIVLEDD